MSSERYVSGLLGEGAAIRKDLATGKWLVEADEVWVREALHASEFLVDKVRALRGSQIVSPGGGTKIESVETSGTNYVITIEDEVNPFVVNDLIRCQVFGSGRAKFYWVQVLAVTGKTITVSRAGFSASIPEAGDEVVQLGNLTDKSRQSAIYISASDSGAPMIDVMEGIRSQSLEGCLKVRLGNLSGITDTNLNPQGYGLYALNCYLSGILRVRNGQTVEEYMQEKIGEAVDAIDFGDDLVTKTEVSASLEVLNKSIASKVSQTDYNASNEIVSERFSTIEQTAGSISLKVDNIKIGGTNLLPNSSLEKTSTIEYLGYVDLTPYLNAGILKIGVTYTISADVKLSSPGDLRMYILGTTGNVFDAQKIITISTQYQRIYMTGQFTRIESQNMLSFYATYGTGRIPTARNIQIEIGNMPTAWSAAPEDMPNALKATGIDITSKRIEATADTFVVRDNAGNVNAVFENGKIKAGRIDVESLTARKLLTADSGGRVEITDSIALYGNDGSNVISISRAAVPQLATLTGQASQSSMIIYGASGDRTGTVLVATGPEIQKDVATTIRIILPKIIVTAISAESSGSYTSNRVELRLEGDGISLAIGSMDAYASYDNPNVVNEFSVDRTITVAPIAATTLKLMAYITCEPNTGQNGYVSIYQGTLTTKTTVNAISYYGNNGFAISMGSEKYLYCAASGNGDTFLTLKGITDLPGVLAAGRVGTTGGYDTSTLWGAKIISGNQANWVSAGYYRLYHNIGHAAYNVTATTVYQSPPCVAYVVAKYATYAEIRTTNMSGVLTNCAFDFMITGKN